MPSDHRLTTRETVRAQDLVGEIFIGGSNKAHVLRAVLIDERWLHGVDVLDRCQKRTRLESLISMAPVTSKRKGTMGTRIAAGERRQRRPMPHSASLGLRQSQPSTQSRRRLRGHRLFVASPHA
jgi:hypothetical protein